jgi:hypothetical protein
VSLSYLGKAEWRVRSLFGKSKTFLVNALPDLCCSNKILLTQQTSQSIPATLREQSHKSLGATPKLKGSTRSTTIKEKAVEDPPPLALSFPPPAPPPCFKRGEKTTTCHAGPQTTPYVASAPGPLLLLTFGGLGS